MTLSYLKLYQLIHLHSIIKITVRIFNPFRIQSVVLMLASFGVSVSLTYAQSQRVPSRVNSPNTLVQQGHLIPWFSAWDLNENPKNRESVLNLKSSGHFFILLNRDRLENPVFIKRIGTLRLFLEQLRIHLVVYILGDFTNEMIRNKMNQFGLQDTDVLIDRYENFVPYVIDKQPQKRQTHRKINAVWLKQVKTKTQNDQHTSTGQQKEFQSIPELIVLDSKGVIAHIPKVGLSLSEELIQDWFK